MGTEAKSEYMCNYYLIHRERILQNAAQKIRCDICDMDVSKCNYKKHLITRKHINNSTIKELQNKPVEPIVSEAIMLLEQYKKMLKG
jgi:hypothetical protein